MESPKNIEQVYVPTGSSHRVRKVVTGAALIVVLAAIGWLAYKYITKHQDEKTAAERTEILNQVAADSAAMPQLSEKEKQEVLVDVKAESGPSTLTEEEKAEILKSVE